MNLWLVGDKGTKPAGNGFNLTGKSTDLLVEKKSFQYYVKLPP